jgi:hypothetical protein
MAAGPSTTECFHKAVSWHDSSMSASCMSNPWQSGREVYQGWSHSLFLTSSEKWQCMTSAIFHSLEVTKFSPF